MEGIAALAIAGVIGLSFTPFATPTLQRLIEERGAIPPLYVAQTVSRASLSRAGITVIAWTLFVGCGVIAVQLRRPYVLLGAIPGFVVVHLVRVGEAGNLLQAWVSRVRAAEPAAWLTLVMIPVTAWAVGIIALSRPRVEPDTQVICMSRGRQN